MCFWLFFAIVCQAVGAFFAVLRFIMVVCYFFIWLIPGFVVRVLLVCKGLRRIHELMLVAAMAWPPGDPASDDEEGAPLEGVIDGFIWY